MNNDSIKHAPGVVCLIQIRHVVGPLLGGAVAEQEQAEAHGRICTIVGPLRPFASPSGQMLHPSDSYNGHAAWMVRAESPLPLRLLRDGRAVLVHVPERPFLQANLIPIADPVPRP